MPITPEHVGRSYPPTEPYPVSRPKIEEFAAALGQGETSAYRGPGAVAPPTFAAVIAGRAWEALFGDPELGLSLSRTVHAEQSFDFLRPLREDDQAQAVLSIEKVRNRGPLDIVTIRVDINVDDQLACRATSTLMHTREAQ